MIYYKSTRGDSKLYSFSHAILEGIAQDGGLFIPEKIPHITIGQLKLLVQNSYQDRATTILNLFQTDFSENTIKLLVKKAYASNFDKIEIAPLVHIKDNQYLLELFHGPTLAFKDMALQLMPLFFSEAVKRDNEKRIKKGEKSLRYLILVATSGDTGKAALEGFKNKENISIIVFYPKNNVSELQELQMITQEGDNVFVYAVKGNFDEVQALVKDIFNNQDFNKYLQDQYQTILSSANSINWGRLLPQIIYYFSGYLDLVSKNAIDLGTQIDIAVPTGNFGNILAAMYAKKMGLPIRKLICASNENHVLTEFLQTGVYDVRKRKLVKTPSPSMDILIASNIERLLYIIANNPQKVSEWMNELKKKGKFTVDDRIKTILQKEFFADWVSNEECLENIKNVYGEINYLMDPHTSVAQTVVKRYIKQNNILNPVIICSTAHWIKFAKDIYKAIYSHKKDSADEFSMIDEIYYLKSSIHAPKSITDLKQKTKIFNKTLVCNINLVEKTIIEDINSKN